MADSVNGVHAGVSPLQLNCTSTSNKAVITGSTAGLGMKMPRLDYDDHDHSLLATAGANGNNKLN
eukprot:5390208-Pleurochrysis_carterae.AAC.1